MTVVQCASKKELRDSTSDMCNDNFSEARMCPDPKMRKAKGQYASFARRRAFGTSFPFAITIVPRSRYLSTTFDSHIALRHRDAEAAVLTSPFFDNVATMFSTNLDQALRFPRAPVDLQLEKSWNVDHKTRVQQSMASANDLESPAASMIHSSSTKVTSRTWCTSSHELSHVSLVMLPS